MTFTDNGKRPTLSYLGETGTSGLLAGGGRPLSGWCSVSVDSGKLVFWLEGLGRKVVDLGTAQVANLPGPLKTDSGKINLQAFSSPFERAGAVCVLMSHFRGRTNPDDPNSPNDNTRDLFMLETPFAVDGVSPQPAPNPTPAPTPQPTPAPGLLDGQVLAKLDQLVKMLDDDWNAAMKPTVLATARIEQALGELSRALADLPAAVWDVPPRPDHDGLPESLRSGTRHQEDGTWQLVRDLRTLLNDPTFPESDPLAPPTG